MWLVDPLAEYTDFLDFFVLVLYSRWKLSHRGFPGSQLLRVSHLGVQFPAHIQWFVARACAFPLGWIASSGRLWWTFNGYRHRV